MPLFDSCFAAWNLQCGLGSKIAAVERLVVELRAPRFLGLSEIGGFDCNSDSLLKGRLVEHNYAAFQRNRVGDGDARKPEL